MNARHISSGQYVALGKPSITPREFADRFQRIADDGNLERTEGEIPYLTAFLHFMHGYTQWGGLVDFTGVDAESPHQAIDAEPDPDEPFSDVAVGRKMTLGFPSVASTPKEFASAFDASADYDRFDYEDGETDMLVAFLLTLHGFFLQGGNLDFNRVLTTGGNNGL